MVDGVTNEKAAAAMAATPYEIWRDRIARAAIEDHADGSEGLGDRTLVALTGYLHACERVGTGGGRQGVSPDEIPRAWKEGHRAAIAKLDGAISGYLELAPEAPGVADLLATIRGQAFDDVEGEE